MLIKGKYALITGAARGLGKLFAQELLQKEAAGVCLVDFNEKLLAATHVEFSNQFGSDTVCSFTADLAISSKVEEAFSFAMKKFGKLHIVCNNAGIANEDDPDRMFAINLTAVYKGTVLGIRHMRRDRLGGEGGVIVNVSSVAGLSAISAYPVYTASKHGVVGLSRAVGNSFTLGHQGVRVNCLCPSFTDTEMVRSQLQSSAEQRDNPNIKNILQYTASVPLLRPEVVADGFVQLVEDDSKNGEVLMVLPHKGLVYRQYSPESRL